MTDPPTLEVQHLTKRYGTNLVLDRVSFTLQANERLGLMGPSGSGKSTLLNCLGGIDRAESGRILLDGQELGLLTPDELAQVRRRSVSTIFQFFHLLPTLTAAENVEFPLQLLGVSRQERAQRVHQLLEEVRLSQRAEAWPEQLSGGEMQRVAIARALAIRPRLILADEPTGNLDSVNGAAVLDLLLNLTDRHRTALILVTHSEEAARICHRVVHLRDGSLSPAEN